MHILLAHNSLYYPSHGGGGTCTAAFAKGGSVTLTAVASGNSVFAGWSGACTGIGACTVTMDGNKTVTATFNRR